MAVYLNTVAETGATLFVTIRDLSTDDLWDNAAMGWDASPTFADTLIPLTEGTAEYAGVYSGQAAAALGSPGEVLLHYFREIAGPAYEPIGVQQIVVLDDEEVVRTASGGGGPSAADIADAVWDELTAAHNIADTFGKLFIDRIDAAISTRLASAGYTAPPTANDVRNAVTGGAYPLATDGGGNVKVSPGTGAGQINLSSGVVPANVTQWLGSAPNALASGRIDASVGAMATDSISAAAVSSAAANKLADAGNARGMSHVEATAELDSRCYAVLAGRNSVLTTDTLTVYRSDDTTVFDTRAIARTAGAVTGISNPEE